MEKEHFAWIIYLENHVTIGQIHNWDAFDDIYRLHLKLTRWNGSRKILLHVIFSLFFGLCENSINSIHRT